MKESRSEEKQLDEALDRSKEFIALRDGLLSKYNSFPAESVRRLNTLLPDSIDTVRLIIDLNTIASRYNMPLGNISVGEPRETVAPTTGIGPKSSTYGSLDISFSVSAPYDQFIAFMGDIERSLRILDVTSVTFGAPSQANGFANYTVSLKTYWLK